MSYANNKITAPVGIYDVQRALGLSSTDLSTLCESDKINPWARWKPIASRPADNNNVPQRLTLAQVKAENYGSQVTLDSWASDFPDEVVKWITNGGLKCKPFNTNPRNQYHRLTDFVAPSDADNPSVRGYDHVARPSGVTVRLNTSDVYTLEPLIPVASRNLVIEADQTVKFAFPKDCQWLPYYYGLDDEHYAQSITLDNDDWLCPLDYMTSDTYGGMIISEITRRAVAIVRHQPDSAHEWNALGWVYDILDGSTHYLDLSASNETILNWGTGGGSETIGSLEGEFMFVELYMNHYENSDLILPIVGFTYQVNIERVPDGMSGVDITNELYFVECDINTTSLYAYISPDIFPISGINNFKEYLNSKYDSLSITIGGVTTNLLNLDASYYAWATYHNPNSEYDGWVQGTVLLESLESTSATQATITCVKHDATQSNSKTIPVS